VTARRETSPARRSDVVGTLPNDAALLRLAGMLLLKQNDEWLVGCRYLLESSWSPRWPC